MKFSCSRLSNTFGFGIYTSYTNGSPSVADPCGNFFRGITIALAIVKWVIRLDLGVQRAN
jgi:hypothetical protein